MSSHYDSFSRFLFTCVESHYSPQQQEAVRKEQAAEKEKKHAEEVAQKLIREVGHCRKAAAQRTSLTKIMNGIGIAILPR